MLICARLPAAPQNPNAAATAAATVIKFGSPIEIRAFGTVKTQTNTKAPLATAVNCNLLERTIVQVFLSGRK